MLFLQMPNLLHRSVLHIASQPEVDLAPGSHAPLATENISNEREAYHLPLPRKRSEPWHITWGGPPTSDFRQPI